MHLTHSTKSAFTWLEMMHSLPLATMCDAIAMDLMVNVKKCIQMPFSYFEHGKP